MSIILAVKESGVVYMGADTQTTRGDTKDFFLNEVGYKITKTPNGELVGVCGKETVKQTLLSRRGLFSTDEDGRLMKKHIVTEIVLQTINLLREGGWLTRDGTIDASILLAHKDAIYKI